MLYQSGIRILALVFLPHLTEAQTPTRESDSVNRVNILLNNHRIDALNLLLGQSRHDTIMVFNLLELSQVLHARCLLHARSFKADAHAFTAVDTILAPALQALNLAKKIRFARGQVHTLRFLGSLNEELLFDYTTALMHYEEAVAIAREANLYLETHNLLGCLLNIYFHLGDFSNAMKVSAEGLILAEKSKDKNRIAKYTSLFGFINLRQKNIKKAFKFYEQYLQQAEEIGDSSEIVDAFNCLGEVHTERGELKQALSLFFKALNFYARKNREIKNSEIANWSADRVPFTLFKIAMAYRSAGDNRQALKYCSLTLEKLKDTGCNDYDLASYYLNTGNIYKDRRDFKTAGTLLRNGLAISKKIRHAENARDAYDYLASMYSLQNKYDSAYYYQSLYSQLKDSITNEKTRREIEQIHSIYNFEKKDVEIAQQQQIHQSEIKRQQLIQYSIISFFIFLVVVSYLLYNRFKLKQKSNFQKLLSQKQNELFNSVITIQDKERKRMAQDLHDSLGSILSAARLKLSDLDIEKGSLTLEEKENYHTTVGLLDEAVVELRNVSRNIMPATLSKIGLIAALRNMLDKISSNGSLKVNYTTHGFNTRLQEETEMSLYRILLELVNNVVKHAQAGEVTVQLIKYPSHINITVEDDGVGFDSKHSDESSNGIGLDNILSRVDYLKGTLDIDTAAGKGTSIIINIPSA